MTWRERWRASQRRSRAKSFPSLLSPSYPVFALRASRLYELHQRLECGCGRLADPLAPPQVSLRTSRRSRHLIASPSSGLLSTRFRTALRPVPIELYRQFYLSPAESVRVAPDLMDLTWRILARAGADPHSVVAGPVVTRATKPLGTADTLLLASPVLLTRWPFDHSAAVYDILTFFSRSAIPANQ